MRAAAASPDRNPAAAASPAAAVAGSSVLTAAAAAATPLSPVTGAGVGAGDTKVSRVATPPLTSLPLWILFEAETGTAAEGRGGPASGGAASLAIGAGGPSSPLTSDEICPSQEIQQLSELLRVPVHGIQLPRMGSATDLDPDPDLVSFLGDTVRSVQPHGPFALLGVGTRGSRAAFELALVLSLALSSEEPTSMSPGAINQMGGGGLLPEPVMLILMEGCPPAPPQPPRSPARPRHSARQQSSGPLTAGQQGGTPGMPRWRVPRSLRGRATRG